MVCFKEVPRIDTHIVKKKKKMPIKSYKTIFVVLIYFKYIL